MNAAMRRYAETVDSIILEDAPEVAALKIDLPVLYKYRALCGPGAPISDVLRQGEGAAPGRGRGGGDGSITAT